MYYNVNTKEEGMLLDEACDDLQRFGKTEITCPRCGNEFIVEKDGWLVRCKTDNCMAYLYGVITVKMMILMIRSGIRI